MSDAIVKPRCGTCQIDSVEWFGTWSWNHKFDTCSICKESIDNSCSLQRNFDALARSGEVVVGQCSHVFHSVCIEEWQHINPTCPLCNQPWVVAFNSNSNRKE